MALRTQDLGVDTAVVYRFPVPNRRRSVVSPARGRGLGLALILLGVIASVLIGGGPQGQAPAGSQVPERVSLRPGETIWQVAERFAPAGVDVRAYVDAILELNGWDAPPPAPQPVLLP